MGNAARARAAPRGGRLVRLGACEPGGHPREGEGSRPRPASRAWRRRPATQATTRRCLRPLTSQLVGERAYERPHRVCRLRRPPARWELHRRAVRDCLAIQRRRLRSRRRPRSAHGTRQRSLGRGHRARPSQRSASNCECALAFPDLLILIRCWRGGDARREWHPRRQSGANVCVRFPSLREASPCRCDSAVSCHRTTGTYTS